MVPISLKSSFGEVWVCPVGASLMSVSVPDRYNNKANVILGYPKPEGYTSDPYYMGSTVGRVAGRIGKASYLYNGHRYVLSANELPENHLHGGFEGFNHKIFTVAGRNENVLDKLTLMYNSADGEEGYPGNVSLSVTYIFTDNILTVKYAATVDQPTPLNITNHSYFNLSGKKQTALDQVLSIKSGQILETCSGYIPTGKRTEITGTPYDFSSPKAISLDKGRLPLPGYNEYFIIDKSEDEEPALSLYDPASGRRMTIKTSYPGILFYTGDYLNKQFIPCQGVCFEAQHYPDAPNHDTFPSIMIDAGGKYEHYIEYNFTVDG